MAGWVEGLVVRVDLLQAVPFERGAQQRLDHANALHERRRVRARRLAVPCLQRELEVVEHGQQLLREALQDAATRIFGLLLRAAAHVLRVRERALELLLELRLLLLQELDLCGLGVVGLRARIAPVRIGGFVHEKMSFTFSKIVFFWPFFLCLPSSSSSNLRSNSCCSAVTCFGTSICTWTIMLPLP